MVRVDREQSVSVSRAATERVTERIAARLERCRRPCDRRLRQGGHGARRDPVGAGLRGGARGPRGGGSEALRLLRLRWRHGLQAQPERVGGRVRRAGAPARFRLDGSRQGTPGLRVPPRHPGSGRDGPGVSGRGDRVGSAPAPGLFTTCRALETPSARWSRRACRLVQGWPRWCDWPRTAPHWGWRKSAWQRWPHMRSRRCSRVRRGRIRGPLRRRSGFRLTCRSR